MFQVDMTTGWTVIPGTIGLTAKLLNGDFDEAASRGHRTRLVRFDPDGRTSKPFSHSYWEEVYLLSGSLTSTADDKILQAPAYVLRPPGTPHGPYTSADGCVLLEIQYFADRERGETCFLDPLAPQMDR